MSLYNKQFVANIDNLETASKSQLDGLYHYFGGVDNFERLRDELINRDKIKQQHREYYKANKKKNEIIENN